MIKKKRVTRKSTEHAVFEQVDLLPAHKLPLNGTNVKLEGLQM